MSRRFLEHRVKYSSLGGAQSLFRSNQFVESKVPGVADASVSAVGTQSISYDLSGHLGDIVQRIDRQYRIGDGWIFARPLLEGSNVSIVTRGGEDGYSCYIKGNEVIFIPADLTAGYTDRKYCFQLEIADAFEPFSIIEPSLRKRCSCTM